MPAGKISICGDQLYLFTRNNGAKTGNEVVIDSHGFKSPHQKDKFTIPTTANGAVMNVHFYTPGGKAVVTTAPTMLFPNGDQLPYMKVVKKVVLNEEAPTTSYATGHSCTNYGLAKIHTSEDTGWKGAISNAVGEKQHVGYADIIDLLNRAPGARDIVGVRSRRLTGYITLQEVVNCLAGMDYTDIHCTFCRSRLLVPEAMYPGKARHFA